MRRAANYERPKINVHHHHHVHYMRYCLACVPLAYAIHIMGILDIVLCLVTGMISYQSRNQAAQEQLSEIVSPNGIRYSYIFQAFEYGFLLTCVCCYLPRVCFYLFFVQGGRKIKRLHWYMGAKSITFFILCLLALATLIITFVFSTMLTSTFGTSVAYMLALFMIPVDIMLAFDLYMCNTTKMCLEERIWKAQPKIQHKRHADDEQPVKTEIIETENSKNAY